MKGRAKKTEDSRNRMQDEIQKWRKELKKPDYSGYMAILVVMVSLVHLLDEYASSSSGAIQSSIINDLFVNQMGVSYTTGLSLMSFVSLLTLISSLFASVFKSLADKYGRKPLFVISAMGMGAGMLICAVAPNAPIYFLGRAVVGFFTATDFQVLYIMEVSPDNRRGVFYSVTKAVGTIGIVLIAVVRGAFLTTDPGAWRKIYLIPAIAGLVLSLIALFASRETKVFMKKRIETLEEKLAASDLEAASKKDKTGLGVGFKIIFRNRELRNQTIATCLFMCGMMAFTGYYESIMTMGGMSMDTVTRALFFYPIAWALLLFISGFISDKMGRKFTTILFGAAALICQAGFIFGAQHGMNPILAGLLLGGAIGCYWTSGNTISMMTNEMAPTRLRASIASVIGILILIATLVSTAVYATLVTVIPLNSLCLWGAVLTVGAGMAFLALTTKETAGMELDSEEMN